MNKERCEAILITDDGNKLKPGQPCGDRAEHTVYGRNVCWVHKNATRELEFVKPEKARK